MKTYTELHNHSYYSFLAGTSSPEHLIRRAAELGMTSLALTDANALYGAVRFAQAGQTHGVRPIFGADLTLEDTSNLTVLVENETGWKNLCHLISSGQHNAGKGEARVVRSVLEEHAEGLIALSGGDSGSITRALKESHHERARQDAAFFHRVFGRDHFFIELHNHYHQNDLQQTRQLHALADALRIGVVASNDVYYDRQAEWRLGDILTCMKHKVSLDESYAFRRQNSEYYLKSPSEMAGLFSWCPEAITSTERIAERCSFSLQYGLQDLPRYRSEAGQEGLPLLRALCEEAFERYSGDKEVGRTRLEMELGVIVRAGLVDYHLIVWDICRFAASRGIWYQTRGSNVGSFTSYLLGISIIDPIVNGLLFERFLSDERRLASDIDIDFANDRREEVVQYIYRAYGDKYAAMVCTFITFQTRSAVREVGKAIGLPLDAVDGLATDLERFDDDEAAGSRFEKALRSPGYQGVVWQQLFDLCNQIRGIPHYLGIHNGGFIITKDPIIDRIPTEPARMPNRVVIQWDKDDVADVGLAKFDILGLAGLAVAAEAERLVRARGIAIDVRKEPHDDPRVYEMLSKGDTIGAFQVDSRAEAQGLQRLKPTAFPHIVFIGSLYRPGPIQAQMVHPFFRRFQGLEPVTYPHESLEPVLKDSYGLFVNQEDLLKTINVFAGLTLGQADLIRRKLAKNNPEDVAQAYRQFAEGARSLVRPEDAIERVWGHIVAFGGYSFLRSHAIVYADLAHDTMWLKAHHLSEFYVAVLNNQPCGFWGPSVVVNDAIRHNMKVLPVLLSQSRAKCTVVSEDSFRLGFIYIDGVGTAGAEAIEAAQAISPFANITDFCRRTRLPRRAVEYLIMAGVMDEWGIPRRKLLLQLATISSDPMSLNLIYKDDDFELREMTEIEQLEAEFRITGLSIKKHPMSLYRKQLAAQRILSSKDLEHYPDGKPIRIAGMVIAHQSPPTAHGVHFFTLEDEYGLINVVVWADVYKRYRRVLRREPFLVLVGDVQHEDGVVNVLADSAFELKRIIVR